VISRRSSSLPGTYTVAPARPRGRAVCRPPFFLPPPFSSSRLSASERTTPPTFPFLPFSFPLSAPHGAALETSLLSPPPEDYTDFYSSVSWFPSSRGPPRIHTRCVLLLFFPPLPSGKAGGSSPLRPPSSAFSARAGRFRDLRFRAR